MASKNPEGDSKREKEEKNKAGHRPTRGREGRGKQGRTLKCIRGDITAFPIEAIDLGGPASIHWPKPALWGRGAISVFLNAFFVGNSGLLLKGCINDCVIHCRCQEV